MGDALALLALALFSCNAFVVRAAARRIDQRLGFLVALAANVVFAAGAVLAHTAVRDGLPPFRWEAVGLFLLAGVLSTYLGRRGYFRSVQTMGPSRAAAVQATNPVFAFLFAWVILGQGLSAGDAAAMVLVVIGLYLTSKVRDQPPGMPLGRVRRLPVSVLGPALVAAVCYALGNVARGAAVQTWNEPILGGLLGAVSGTAAYLLLHISVPRLVGEVRAADPRGLLLWSCAGGLTIAGQISVIAATAHIPIAVAVAISSALPIVVLPASVLFLRGAEQLSWRTALGALAIVVGVVSLVLR